MKTVPKLRVASEMFEVSRNLRDIQLQDFGDRNRRAQGQGREGKGDVVKCVEFVVADLLVGQALLFTYLCQV